MAIRVSRKIKKFEYEGQLFALRRPNTAEMVEIARLASAYNRTVKKEVEEDTKAGIFQAVDQSGDMALLFDAEKYVAKLLVIDPETNEPVFGPNSGNNVEDVDHDFIVKVWVCYNGADEVKEYNAYRLQEILQDDAEAINEADLAFIENNAKISAQIVHNYIAEIRKTDLKRANRVAYALNYKPVEVDQQSPLTTGATTTSSSEETSSASPSSSTSTPPQSEDGSTATS